MPTIEVLDSTMFYEEAGTGRPFVFLHGNPTSSYVWRNVLPRIGEPVRRLAPDLIGMGRSGKPDVPYGFADHARYLDAWFDALGLDGVVLVGIDWGGALAFDWAARHPARTSGVAFMETIVRPMTWAEFPGDARPRLEALRTPGVGETKVLDENFFIEQALRATVLRGLSDEDLDVYRSPYPTRESRRPLLAWPRAWPIDGEPADVTRRMETYDDWLASSEDVPKLLLTFDGPPNGLVMDPDMISWCVENIANLEMARCGQAAHVAPEDQPEAIAAAIAGWADRHQLRSDPQRKDRTMSPNTTFGAPVIGQTEKALNAILNRQLAGTGLTEPQWVTLAVASGGTADLHQLIGRVAGALKVSEAGAQAHITELTAAQLLHVPDGEGSPVELTDAGRKLQAEIRTAVTQITERLWGDLPPEDLDTAGRVLSTVLARANTELAPSERAVI